MADQITDNRTAVCVAQTSTPASETWAASSSATEDVEIFIEGTTSIAEQISDSLRYIMYDVGSPQNWSNNVFYMWINCGIVGLLDLKANGGFRMRFAGATITDYFEVYIGGNDFWPTAIAGGWVQFVVDIEEAHTNSDAVGGTKPATSAIQYVGWAGITATVKTRNADNTWVDAIWRLPDGSPGIIVEGRNGGTTDWDFNDIFTQLTQSAGSFIPGPGGSWVCNTSIQFGINDTSTHAFTDSNTTVLWAEGEHMPTDLLSLSALGNSGGTTNVTFGTKSGTGDTATGAQGVIFQAASTGVRWAMDFNDPNIDSVGLYGCNLIHGGGFLLDDPAVSVISSQYIDCSSALISNSEQLRNKVVNANTLDDVAFMTTDDLTDIVFCEFEFSDGHAVELTTPIVATQSSKGNLFTGYGATGTTDAAVYNNAGGLVTIGVTDNGDAPSYKNGTSATTVVNNAVVISVSGVSEGAAVKVIANETVGTITTGDVIFEILADSNGVAELTTFNYEAAFDPSGLDVIVRARAQGLPTAAIADDNGVFTNETSEANSSTIGDMNLLPTTPVVNEDRFILGHAEQFNRIKLDISTAGTGGFTITWQYWNGAWTNLSGVVDNTSSLSVLGNNEVSWTMPGDWTTTTINGQGPFYFIRAAYTAGTVTVTPLGRKCKLDVTRYFPFNQDRIIDSTGLAVVASWIQDGIASF